MYSYCSAVFLGVFLPLTIAIYQALPQKGRRVVLLAASYVFFWILSGKLLLYLLFSTLSVHHIGLWLSLLGDERDAALRGAQRSERKAIKQRCLHKQRLVMGFAVVLHIGILLAVKYTAFFGWNLNNLFDVLHLPIRLSTAKILAPIGISFYTLQALSYLFDVYRGSVAADRNLFRLALFMSFFPQIMEGPICRYSDTAQALWECPRVSYRSLTFGAQRILYGVMKMVVVADRLNSFIKPVFADYAKYDGGVIALAAVGYTCQLYMDFSGTMDIVIGAAEIFGIRLPENFRQPFFSKSISEFWKRWHITLGTWFRDYIFYPVTLSKPLKKLTTWGRKRLGNHFGPLLAGAVALFCVWFSNGIWHGAGWNYIFFGIYHFVLILLGNVFEPFVHKTYEKLRLRRNGPVCTVLRILKTGVLVCIGELFFRAPELGVGMKMFGRMVSRFTLSSFASGRIFEMGMDRQDFIIVGVTVAVVFLFGVLKERGVQIRQRTAEKPVALRWALYYALILFIIVFGAYGPGYIPLDPIYANF